MVEWILFPTRLVVSAVHAIKEFVKANTAVDLLNLAFQAASFIIAIYVLVLARRQLVPLREDIKRLASVQARHSRYRSELVAPKSAVRVVGFDARLTSADWGDVLGGDAAPKTIRMDLHRSYNTFYDQLEQTPPPFGGPTVMILAQAHIPQYLARGLIEPLPEDLALDTMLDRRSSLRGQPCDLAVRRLAKLLFSDSNGTVGALPLWLNSHGRMIPDPQLTYKNERLVTVSTLDELFTLGDGPLRDASIQSYHVMLEFWAHLAYRGCRLFVTSSNGHKQFQSALLSSPDQLLKFAQAVADLATRLRSSDRTREVYRTATTEEDLKDSRKFRIGHSEDARMVREGLALWKPVFSSELLWKTLGRRGDPATRLTSETEFKAPFFRYEGEHDWSYLTALGGYGLALPAGSSGNKDCQKALKYLFLANPALYHPSLADMLGQYDSESAVREFAERHGRPRWPFWRQVESEIRSTVFGLLLSLERGGVVGPQKFWASSVEKIVESRASLVTLFERIRSIAHREAPPWAFDF